MAHEPEKITEPTSIALSNIIRDRESTPEELNRALANLGTVVGYSIISNLFLSRRTIVTPLDRAIENSVTIEIPFSIVMTTKEDLQYFGEAIKRSLNDCEIGWINFEGRRGIEALNSPVRYTKYPETYGKPVDSLIIAKATLATGCTALSLTKSAFERYMPNRLIIASIFYSREGLQMLQHEFPNAHIFVVGEPDTVNDQGLLIPGIGDLALRTEVA